MAAIIFSGKLAQRLRVRLDQWNICEPIPQSDGTFMIDSGMFDRDPRWHSKIGAELTREKLEADAAEENKEEVRR